MSETWTVIARALDTARTPEGILDILLVWFLVYAALSLLRGSGTRRWRGLGLGLMALALAWLVTRPDRGLIKLDTFNWLLTELAPMGSVALVVVFQPEIRQSLHKIGQWTLFGSSSRTLRSAVVHVVNELVEAADGLARRRIGALFVIQRRDTLGEVIETGKLLDAEISTELLATLFFPSTPLHDGAAVIVDERVVAATCLLPLSERRDLSRGLGTRHRAALGLSERCDAVVLVVSEETGVVSLAVGGELQRELSGEPLRARLLELLQPAGSGLLASSPGGSEVPS
ncbi:MAG: TIGR00159 family protein [Armatimonadetes bacterium]|nr:TIGR00159 family protein [Armatimonadota bacterium]